MTFLRKALDALYWGCGAIAGLFMVAICALMMAMSLGRELAVMINDDGFARWLKAAAAFLGIDGGERIAGWLKSVAGFISIRGGDEITGWLMAACAFLGLAYTFKHGDLIRVTLLIERFTGSPRRWLELLALGIGGLFLGLFAWFCVRMVYDSWRFNEFAQGVIAIPIWIPQSGLALGVVVLFLAFVDEFVRVALGHAPCYHRELPRTADEIIERAAESGV